MNKDKKRNKNKIAFVCHHNTFLIYQSLKKPTLKRFSAVTHMSTLTSLPLSLLMALAGYMTYVEKTRANLFLNMPPEALPVTLARLAFVFNMYTTVPLELFVAREVVDQFFFAPLQNSHFPINNNDNSHSNVKISNEERENRKRAGTLGSSTDALLDEVFTRPSSSMASGSATPAAVTIELRELRERPLSRHENGRIGQTIPEISGIPGRNDPLLSENANIPERSPGFVTRFRIRLSAFFNKKVASISPETWRHFWITLVLIVASMLIAIETCDVSSLLEVTVIN